MPTMQEVIDKYLVPEYLNVQDPAAFKAQVLAELQKATSAPAPQPKPAPVGG